MVQTDTVLGLVGLGGLLVGMALLGTGNPSDLFLGATAAAFAIGVLALIALIFFGGEE